MKPSSGLASHFVLFSLAVGAAAACAVQNNIPEGELTPDTGPSGDSAIDTGATETDPVWDTGDDTPVLADMKLTPSNAVVYIDTGKTPLTGGVQAFTAALNTTPPTDVTATTTFSVADTTLGSFSGATFTSVTDLGKDSTGAPLLGKTSIVDAINADGKKGQAKITVVKLRKTEDPTTSARDFFFTVPYKAPPDPPDDILKFTTNIQQVDVAFVMDSTGSMSGPISNLKTTLSTTIMPALKAAIPSVGVAVVDHKDFPTGSYGGTGDFPVKILSGIVVQATPADLTTVQTAVGKYSASGGYDTPESQIAAMYHTLTGKVITWPGGTVAAVTPKAGTTGAVGFRGGAVPVVVMITDASWHNGVYGSVNGFGETIAYSFASPKTADLKDAFKTANAKFVGVNVAQSWSTSDSPGKDMADMSDATSSNLPPTAFDGPGKPTGCGTGQCCTGLSGAGRAPDAAGGKCRLNFDSNSSGSGVSTGIVTAIKAIAAGSVYDILPELANDTTNPGGVDATIFIDRLEAFADTTKGCSGTPRKSDPAKVSYNDMIGGIIAGKQTACFKIIAKQNDTVPSTEVAQFFKAKIRMKGIAPGVIVGPTTPRVDLGDERTVLFLVPPKDIGIK